MIGPNQHPDPLQPFTPLALWAIGGMMMGGLAGLFVGSVVLALAYKIISMLMED